MAVQQFIPIFTGVFIWVLSLCTAAPSRVLLTKLYFTLYMSVDHTWTTIEHVRSDVTSYVIS